MKKNFQKILIIQTAFLGDVILATSLIEKLHEYYPDAALDFLLRKGNESVLHQHPYLRKIYVWNKQKSKYKSLWKIFREVRTECYDLVINLQRFATMGIFAGLSGGKKIACFDKNPFAWLATHTYPHLLDAHTHEVQRNQLLISEDTDELFLRPKLYPQTSDYQEIEKYQTQPYICVAPTSVWFTKQFPKEKWIAFLKSLPKNSSKNNPNNEKYAVFLLGANADSSLCNEIIQESGYQNTQNLAGKLSLLQSAALMQKAIMNYVNDSAPMHLCSSMNAPTCAVYCSTLPAFGFFPLSERSFIVEISQALPCRPCGLHGKKSCPQTHLNCAKLIDNQRLIDILPTDAISF